MFRKLVFLFCLSVVSFVNASGRAQGNICQMGEPITENEIVQLGFEFYRITGEITVHGNVSYRSLYFDYNHTKGKPSNAFASSVTKQIKQDLLTTRKRSGQYILRSDLGNKFSILRPIVTDTQASNEDDIPLPDPLVDVLQEEQKKAEEVYNKKSVDEIMKESGLEEEGPISKSKAGKLERREQQRVKR